MTLLLRLLVLIVIFSPVSNAYAQSDDEMKPDTGGAEAVKSIPIKPQNSAADDKVMPLPTEAKDKLDPISGTVPLSDVPHYNIYERQIRYKKADKEFRNSIEARRESFEKPFTTDYEAYQTKLSDMYAKEGAAMNKPTVTSPKIPPLGFHVTMPPIHPHTPKDNRPVVPIGEPGDGMDQAPQSLKEKETAVKQASTTTSPKPQAQKGATAPTEEKKVGVKEIDIQGTPEEGTPSKKVIVPEDAPDFQKSPFD